MQQAATASARLQPVLAPVCQSLTCDQHLLIPQGGSSMLSKMFSGEMEPGLRDEQGHVYIDR